jgi:hypothetical protein
MLYVLKIIHIFALVFGAGSGITNGILASRIIKNPDAGPPPPMVVGLMQTMGKIGPIAMILLWLSGLGLVYAEFGSLDIGALFYLKLAGATLALVCVMLMARMAMQAQAAGTPPPLKTMKKISHLVWLGVLTAVTCAVVLFN